jgi:23S rRNA pseudouridine1911/1915/1917 synthase
MQPTVIYEDNHLLALNKPAGYLVQGDQTGDPTLTDWGKNYLKERYAKPGAVFLNPVHRIDRPVSGLVLFARTDKALSRLTQLFKNQAIEKRYHALCLKMPPASSGELRHFLLKDGEKNVVRLYDEPFKDAKACITRYQYLAEAGIWFLLEANPITGRSHQIRAQLASIGAVILGDLKYGAREALPDQSIALHCRSMAFEHPVKKEWMTIEAPYPDGASWWKSI